MRAVALLILLILLAPMGVRAAEAPLARVIIALIEPGPGGKLKESRSHQMATMPLEQLGLIVEYHHADEPLPDLTGRDDVRGIMTWFTASGRPGARRMLDWLDAAVADGKKLVILGEIGLFFDPEAGALPLPLINRLVERLGVHIEGSSVPYTGAARYLKLDKRFWAFERMPALPLPFPVQAVIAPDVTTHVEVELPGAEPQRSAVVVTGPHGAIVAPGYTAEIDAGAGIRRWLIDPFNFFRAAFATDDLPKPDTTTLVGRRLYYSHVDGDGWRSVSEVKLNDKPAIAARVLLENVVRLHPDLPVTIAPIAAELDPNWIDDEEAREVAKELIGLAHVEAGSHTYSHPFSWNYFTRYDAAAEREIARRNASGDSRRHAYESHSDPSDAQEADEHGSGDKPIGLGKYSLPRAFFSLPYDLEREIAGSADKIAEVAGKPVTVLQWSGDTTPYEAAIAATRKAGLLNINGGDTRFDSDYRSYGFVAPISVPVGDERQIYSSMSNENTYTDLWTNRFFAYRHLLQTINRTDLPIRVKPINVYYHSYSAERVASINALLRVYQDVRNREIAPVTTSRFAAIANGFYSTRMIPLGERRWRIENRGALQTLRFDRASLTAVDFARSTGVLGERASHGGLYVALDPAEPAPVVALTARADPLTPAASDYPYLRESRWPVQGLTVDAAGAVDVVAQGFGPLSMTWVVPQPGTWTVRIRQNDDTVFEHAFTVGEDRILVLHAGDPVTAVTATAIRIERDGG